MTAQLMPTMTVTGSVSLTEMRANSTVLLITLPIAVVTIIIIALITLSIAILYRMKIHCMFQL